MKFLFGPALHQEARALFRLSLPLMVGSLGNMAMSLVDTMILGRHSSYELAAMASGNSVFVTLSVIGIGFLFAMDPLVASAVGRAEDEQAKHCLISALQLSVGFGLFACLFSWVLSYHLEFLGSSAELREDSASFLRAMSFGLLPMLFFQCFQRYWQGYQKVVPFTLCIIFANVLNYAAARFFVEGAFGFPSLGADGIAWATFVVRMFCLGFAVIYSLKQWKNKRLTGSESAWLRAHLPMIRQLLRLGLPSMATFCLEVFAFTVTTMLATRLGPLPVAAHQVVLGIASFAYMLPLGLSGATATRVAYHRGRNNNSQAWHSAWLGLAFSLAIMSLTGAMFLLYPRALLSFFSQDPALIDMTLGILFLCALFQLFDGIQVTAAGALRGFDDTRTPFLTNLFAHWCLGLPVGSYLCFWRQQGIAGLWTGLAIGLCVTALLNALVLWQKSRSFPQGKPIA